MWTQNRAFVSRFGPDDAEIRGKTNFSRARLDWVTIAARRERCCNDAQQWTTVQRAPRRDAGAYRGSCPRHGYVPSMKESKRNNCISGPGGHCSTAAHARLYLTVLTLRLPLRAEAALVPPVPRARQKLAPRAVYARTSPARIDSYEREIILREYICICEVTRWHQRDLSSIADILYYVLYYS